MACALKTTKLSKRFGDLTVLNDVNLNIQAGTHHALIGPNGAGKTTLVNILSGLELASSGSVFLDGQDISHLSAHQRCRQGLARTFQINQPFPDMTVLEAVTMATYEHLGLGKNWWRPISAHPIAHEQATQLLETLQLLPQADTISKKLAYGQQRLVEIALALASKPHVLILDEPAAGLPAQEALQLFKCLANLPNAITILLIEHNMDLVFQFADQISVLVDGKLIVQGSSQDVANHPQAQQAYLGTLPHG